MILGLAKEISTLYTNWCMNWLIICFYIVPDRCVRSLNPCLNGAECYNDESYEGGVRCECAAGWTGYTCADAEGNHVHFHSFRINDLN